MLRFKGMINSPDIRKTPCLYIEWLDSEATPGWSHERKFAASPIVSIGFLVEETPDHVTITTSISTNGSIMDPLTIPRCAITKQKRVAIFKK